MSTISIEEVKEAYNKLRSYIYHDNTDLHLRKQLVEFETGITKDPLYDYFGSNRSIYQSIRENKRVLNSDDKLEYFTKQLNNYHRDNEFFETLYKEISINFYPKKIKSKKVESNFISNKTSL